MWTYLGGIRMYSEGWADGISTWGYGFWKTGRSQWCLQGIGKGNWKDSLKIKLLGFAVKAINFKRIIFAMVLMNIFSVSVDLAWTVLLRAMHRQSCYWCLNGAGSGGRAMDSRKLWGKERNLSYHLKILFCYMGNENVTQPKLPPVISGWAIHFVALIVNGY